ncbi:unnamed protein product [Adineta steineri]|uniref:N-acetyltransferase domain-containing protein n=1 Tax=Adineta steineri TaxID=433720 RepID=A0A814D264_9BILA|nr:unnamed protein product [Adineta steineri]CAF0956782.1 unnamed protein product [Adineta steineri]CAF0961829.1 unnamed protein product [Adineta steineri]
MTLVSPISYTCIPYSFLTDRILEKCSTLFNNNYGIWAHDAPLHSNNTLKAGSRVKLGIKRLRELLLFNDHCFLVVAEIRSSDNDQFQLIGHAFCTYAKYDPLNGNAVWITQLVVDSSYRRQGVAGTLLSMATNNVEDVVIAGLVSSNPYAVMSLCNACNRIPINLKFIGDHAENVIRVCNIPYLSHTQVVGSVFDKQSPLIVDIHHQPISLAKTDFFVDHNEILIILKKISKKWFLGPLLDGHEFLVVFPTSSVRRSRTTSNGSPSNISS